MPKPLAELRKSDHVGLPERSFSICVAGKLLALIEEKDEQFRKALEAEEAAPRKRVGSKSKAQQYADEMQPLIEEMDEHTVHGVVRGIDSEVWRAWCAAHPAREGNTVDTRTFMGICDSDALLTALAGGRLDEEHPLVVSLNGEKPTDGDWDFVWANAVHGDKMSLAKLVVSMHEQTVDIPKSRRDWLREFRSETDSE